MHHLPVHEAVALLECDSVRGLGDREAARRLARRGPNVLPRVERRGALARLLAQLQHPLIYVLLASAAITLAIGEQVDAAVILGVVVATAAVGFAQEARAERALDALASMVTVDALVLRDGRPRRVAARDLVPGDVALLRPGDRVSADIRLLDVAGLAVDESALTGESVPVAKALGVLERDTSLGDRANMAFSGTLVTAGRGMGVVVATGGDTSSARSTASWAARPTSPRRSRGASRASAARSPWRSWASPSRSSPSAPPGARPRRTCSWRGSRSPWAPSRRACRRR